MTEKKKLYYAITADDLQTMGHTSIHKEKIRQVQVPSFARDVALIVILFAGLAALAALAGVELVIRVVEIIAPSIKFTMREGWAAVPFAASIAGLAALFVRLQLWDQVWKIRPEPPIAQPLEEVEPADFTPPGREVIAQVQRADGVIRYQKYGSFKGWRRADFQKLAQLLYDNQDKTISRDLLASFGLWKNITGKGGHHDYKYQDIFGDLAWLGWVIDGRVTQEGLDWANETKPGLMDPPPPNYRTVDLERLG